MKGNLEDPQTQADPTRLNCNYHIPNIRILYRAIIIYILHSANVEEFPHSGSCSLKLRNC